MSRYIDANKLKKSLSIPCASIIEIGETIIAQIDDQPTADVRENVKGEWIDCEVVHDRKDAKITDWQQARCSVCGKWHTTPYMYSWYHFEYCPNCGADMRGEQE